MPLRYRGDRRWLIPHPTAGWGDGVTYGAAQIPGPCGRVLRVIFSDGSEPTAEGWDHVSVSLPNRCPNWPEMCAVKDLFFDAEDVVVQFHPARSQYVNNHPYCLHLWHRPGLLTPPAGLVGVLSSPKEETDAESA